MHCIHFSSLCETWSFSFLSQEMVLWRWNRHRGWRSILSYRLCCALWGSPWVRSTIYNSIVRHQCSGGTSCNYPNISLPISFLTLAWAFTATNKRFLAENKLIPSSGDLNVKHQLALYVINLLLLSSRLFAICYFTVSYASFETRNLCTFLLCLFRSIISSLVNDYYLISFLFQSVSFKHMY